MEHTEKLHKKSQFSVFKCKGVKSQGQYHTKKQSDPSLKAKISERSLNSFRFLYSVQWNEICHCCMNKMC